MQIREEPQNLDKAFPFSIGEIRIRNDPAKKDVFHWHDCLEITCIREGSGRYYVNGKIYEMRAGDIIIFNSVEPHAWDVTGDGGMLALVTVFSPSLVAEKTSLFDYEYLGPFLERGPNFKNRLPGEEGTTRRIFALLESACEEYARRREGYNLMIKAIILQVLTLLIRYYQDGGKPRVQIEKRRADMERIEKALDFIQRNYSGDISLDDAARAACMSPNYFSAFFRRTVGETFIDYLCRCRILAAHEAICSSDRSITRIAADCGYNNLSNFYRAYHKMIGERPSESRMRRNGPESPAGEK